MDKQRRPNTEVPERPRPRSYSARYKAEILAVYERLDKAAKGALLRRQGLYTSLISEWRKQRDRGALQALARRRAGHRLIRWSGRMPGCAVGSNSSTAAWDTARRVIEVQGRLSALLEQLAADSAPPTGGEQQ